MLSPCRDRLCGLLNKKHHPGPPKPYENILGNYILDGRNLTNQGAGVGWANKEGSMAKELSTSEVGSIGEQIVKNYLIQTGHTNVKVDTFAPGKTDVESDTWLVQVKTSVSPYKPGDLTSDEVRDIKSRAAKLKKEAYKAQLSIDDKNLLVGSIQFTDLFAREKSLAVLKAYGESQRKS
jgi:hypothetical protein